MSTRDCVAQAIAERIGPVDTDTDYERGRRIARMQPECFIVQPGLVQLEPYEPPDKSARHVRLGLSPRIDDFASADLDEFSTMQVLTLEAKDWVLTVDTDVNEPEPLRYDNRSNWKRFPPSKRKRMASWRRATDREKLRYAPLAGRVPSVPRWARHPDHYKLRRLGDATVVQRIRVYAQMGADVSDQLEQHSREWVHRVAYALAAPKRD
jgi:hypothetical protein